MMWHRGFTLIELLVSLAIFSLMSALAYGGLLQVTAQSRQTEARTAQLARLQRCDLLLGRDLEQASMRSVRDELGDPRPVLSGGGLSLLEFSRALDTGSGTQRVAYRLESDRLLRLTWSRLDRVPGDAPRSTPLLEGVERVAVRFLDHGGEWHLTWPPGGTVEALPAAVELAIEVKGRGGLRRLYRLPGERYGKGA